MSAGRFSLLFVLLTFISCFATVGLRITIVSDEQSKKLASDVASSILSLVPQNVFVSIEMDGATLTSNELASIEEEFALSFSISYDATRNAYYASWLEFDSVFTVAAIRRERKNLTGSSSESARTIRSRKPL